MKVKEMSRIFIGGAGALFFIFAGCTMPKVGEFGYVDEEGFTWRDGRVAPGEATSDY